MHWQNEEERKKEQRKEEQKIEIFIYDFLDFKKG